MNLRTEQFLRLTAVVGIVLIAVAVWFWQAFYTSPQQVFNDMLENNLTTTSVTKNVWSNNGGDAVNQRINLQLGAHNVAQWFATIHNDKATVSTESIGTKDAGYVRYTDSSSQKNNKDIINIWAKSTTKGATLRQLFQNALLDTSSAPVPPLGYVNATDRATLLKFTRDHQIFKPDYKTVSTSVVNGRPAYNYSVSVSLAPYIQLMQGFAHVYGLKLLDDINAAEFTSSKPVTITLSVDKRSHQMVRVIYPTTGFNETYTDYGVARTISLPTETISETELQKRVQAIQ
jgi:hypothetical protein